MGTRDRAERISKHFSNRAMQAIGFYIFDKCGNCIYRIPCIVEGTLKTGGHPDPLGKIVDDLSKGCIKYKTYKGHGLIAKNVAAIARQDCKECTMFPICVANICKEMKITDTDKVNIIKEQANKCVRCEHIEDCVQTYVEEFKISNYKVMTNFFLTRFRRCNKDGMQTVSSDVEKNNVSPQNINMGYKIVEASPHVGDKDDEKPLV